MLFLLLIVGGVGVPFFPEDATLFLCGMLIKASTVKSFPALLVVYAGLLIADFAIYSLGRRYGRQVVTHRRFHKLLSPERFARLEKRFLRHGSTFILVARNIIGLRVQMFLVSGIMRMPRWKFILTDALASVLTLAIWVSAGYAGGHGLKGLGQVLAGAAPWVPFLHRLAV